MVWLFHLLAEKKKKFDFSEWLHNLIGFDEEVLLNPAFGEHEKT